MNNIECILLRPEAIAEACKLMVAAARLTQGGHKIKNSADFMDLWNKPYSARTVKGMTELPHPTIQKFGLINMVIIGASRRFLAQITRHQNEVKFMSASLQYSDYSDDADFVVPYELLGRPAAKADYLESCKAAMEKYRALTREGYSNDTAGYLAPQSLRNVLIISATPYQWKHMISQRTCRRNTDETRYVMLTAWRLLYSWGPVIFSPCTTGPECIKSRCLEGKFSCGASLLPGMTPSQILETDFPLLMEGAKHEN